MTLIQILEGLKEALDVHQMAELLSVSERHIYELAADGSLPSFRVGKTVRFDPQDIANWLRKKKPSEDHDTPRKSQRHEGAKLSRGEAVPAHVWRKKVNSLEAALVNENSSADLTKSS
jgi:excisionase family DNA binding protein